MPTVDIIIPAYNAARYLPTALDSVIAQTFPDWRILLVDDGSTDNTPALAATYQQRLGEKLLHIRQQNAGLPAARNTAIRHATAEFLALLDADDVWLPQRLERSVAAFKDRPQVGLSYGYNARIDPEGNVIEVYDQRNMHAEGKVAPHIYMRTLDLCCPTVTFRRSCALAVGGFDETLRATEDRDLWLRIAQTHEVALIPEVIAYYRSSPTAMTTDGDRMLRAQLQFVQKHYGTPGCGSRARRVALSWIYRQRAEALINQGKKRDALTHALRASAFYPFDRHTLRTTASILLRCTGLLRTPMTGINKAA